MSQLQELISPAQSQILVMIAAIALTVIGAIWGFVAARARGLVAALGGPLVFLLWLIHGALTAKFGMDSLWLLLLGEAAFVIVAGALLGLAWSAIIGTKREENAGEIQLERKLIMAQIYYDADADLKVLEGKTIAVIGYGSQGRGQSLCSARFRFGRYHRRPSGQVVRPRQRGRL